MPCSECLRSLQCQTALHPCSTQVALAAWTMLRHLRTVGQQTRVNPLILRRVTNRVVGAVAPGAASRHGPLITESMSPSSQPQTNIRVAVAQMTSTGG